MRMTHLATPTEKPLERPEWGEESTSSLKPCRIMNDDNLAFAEWAGSSMVSWAAGWRP